MTIAQDAVNTCIECGLCEQVQQEGCGSPAGMWGPFAAHLIEQAKQGAIDADTERLLFTCALCDNCTSHCPVDIKAALIAREGRAVFHELNPTAAATWRPMHIDLAGNSFSKLRSVRHITYPEALDESTTSCPSVFLPGCTLCTYSPELTHAVTQFLLEAGQIQGITTHCCGNPLWAIGLAQRCITYAESLNERFVAHGVTRVIAACPNCYRALVQGRAEGLVDARIAIEALPQVLVDEGMHITQDRMLEPNAQTFSVHDSCPDRALGVFGEAVRNLLPANSCIEMQHTGPDAICCGSGGVVSPYNVDVCVERRSRRLEEFNACGADCMVTSCISCSNSILRANSQAPVRHYLELLFDVPIDWEAHRNAGAVLSQAGAYNFDSEEDNKLLLA